MSLSLQSSLTRRFLRPRSPGGLVARVVGVVLLIVLIVMAIQTFWVIILVAALLGTGYVLAKRRSVT